MIQATENLPFGNLLLQRFPLQIPKYQRSYAWDEEELDDFIRDITELYTARINNPEKSMPHFFGGIVSVKRTAGGTYSGNEYDVVDGQQRLTTVTLALNALLSGLEQIAEEAISSEPVNAQTARAHADVLHNKYVAYQEVVQGQIRNRYRLNLSKADDVYFKQVLDNAGTARTQASFTRDSHRRIQNAWKIIHAKLIATPILSNSSLSMSDKIARLLTLHSCLTEDCYIIHIISDNHNEAYRLFSILNDRGKNLSDGDLLRSYTLEVLEDHPQQQSSSEAAWDQILGYRDLQVDMFLKAFYPSHQGERAPQRDVATAYRSVFFSFPTPLQASDANIIRDRILEMEKDARAFIDISEGVWPYSNPCVAVWDRDRLQRLVKTLKHTICMPLLLSAYHCLSEIQFAEIVSLLERFSFRYITIVGAHAGRLGNVYNSQARLIRTNPSAYTITSLKAQLQGLQDSHAKDLAFTHDLLEQLSYNAQSMRIIIRYFLSTIEDYYKWYHQGANGKPVPDKTRVFDLNTLTIEHIHAQNPQTPNQPLDMQVHSLPNLSFWGASDNQAASNSSFLTKKSMYQASSVALNRELANLANWDVAEFTSRQQKLIKMALKIFTA